MTLKFFKGEGISGKEWYTNKNKRRLKKMMDLGLVVILFILAICLLKWSNVCIYKIEYELFKKRVLKRMRIIKIMTDNL